jgi:farnesyl-diphosphate farnesyltransferase
VALTLYLLSLPFSRTRSLLLLWRFRSICKISIDVFQKKQGAYGKVRVHKEPPWMQLLRVDEVFAAFMLLHVRPLKSNLQQSSYIQNRYPPSDLHFCNDMLERVSRSFAAVIQQLPETLLVDVLVFYLVLRALDTIEDDTSLDPTVKIRLLQQFAHDALVNNNNHADGRSSSWSVNDVDIGEGDERVLLQQFSRVHSVFQRLPSHSQQVIVDITDRMAHGMASYVNQDFRQGTANLDEYNLYCHYGGPVLEQPNGVVFAKDQHHS